MYLQKYNQFKKPSGVVNLSKEHSVSLLITTKVGMPIAEYLAKINAGIKARQPDAFKYKTIWVNEEEIKATRQYVDRNGRMIFSTDSPKLKNFIYIRPIENKKEDLITLKEALKEEKKLKKEAEKKNDSNRKT